MNHLSRSQSRALDSLRIGGHATFLRSDFHGAILQHLSPRVRTFTSKRLVSYQEPDDISQPISLCFKDGSTATCDILVGADGIKSAVRGSMLEAMAKNAEDAGDSTKAQDMHGLIPAKFSGAIAYRTLIPAEKLSGMVSGHPCLSRPMFVSMLPCCERWTRKRLISAIHSIWERIWYDQQHGICHGFIPTNCKHTNSASSHTPSLKGRSSISS